MPLQKGQQDGAQPYTTRKAMLALEEKIAAIQHHDMALDLLPMFESRSSIEAWLEAFNPALDRLAAG